MQEEMWARLSLRSFVSICNIWSRFWQLDVTDGDSPDLPACLSQSVTLSPDFGGYLLQIETLVARLLVYLDL